MFPCFAEIVAGVPASDRYPGFWAASRLPAETPWRRPVHTHLLDPIRELVQCQVASLLRALVATPGRYRPARTQPAEPRGVR